MFERRLSNRYPLHSRIALQLFQNSAPGLVLVPDLNLYCTSTRESVTAAAMNMSGTTRLPAELDVVVITLSVEVAAFGSVDASVVVLVAVVVSVGSIIGAVVVAIVVVVVVVEVVVPSTGCGVGSGCGHPPLAIHFSKQAFGGLVRANAASVPTLPRAVFPSRKFRCECISGVRGSV